MLTPPTSRNRTRSSRSRRPARASDPLLVAREGAATRTVRRATGPSLSSSIARCIQDKARHEPARGVGKRESMSSSRWLSGCLCNGFLRKVLCTAGSHNLPLQRKNLQKRAKRNKPAPPFSRRQRARFFRTAYYSDNVLSVALHRKRLAISDRSTADARRRHSWVGKERPIVP